MKGSYKEKVVAGMMALVVSTGLIPFAALAQTASSTPTSPSTVGKTCARWGLYWIIDDPANQIVSKTRVVSDPRGSSPNTAIPNPVIPSEEGATDTDSPGFPYYGITIADAQWMCEKFGTAPLDSARTEAEKAAPEGMELCAQAAKLAARFGSLTALDLNFSAKIQTTVLNNAINFLQGKVLEATNGAIDIKNVVQSIITLGTSQLSSVFDSLVTNPLKTTVNKQIDKIEGEAKAKLQQVGQKALSNIAGSAGKAIGQTVGKALGSVPIPGAGVLGDLLSGGGSSPQAVLDQDVLDQLKAMEKKQDQNIAEQKIAQANADTRAKCAELLKTTNETIKRALLYQLSTQVMDWIQTGKTPQFIKQPGKFLEDTGRLAVDRFISRVAPRLCEPFRLSVQLQIPSVRREDNPFYQQVTCTLDKVVANMENFYSDFRAGGWIGYQEILRPQNNYYGASLMVHDQQLREAAAAQDAAQQSQNRGFAPVKRCTEWVKFVPYSGPTTYVLDLRDDGTGHLYTRAPDQSPDVSGGEGPLDADGESGLAREPQTGPLEQGVRYWKSDNSYFWECESDEITQPATIAANLSEKASQTDFDNLAASQDVSLFLQTIEDAIVNKLVKAGTKGIPGILKGLPSLTP
jgi:hypothetical protein